MNIEFSIIIETHTIDEGGDLERMSQAIRAACELITPEDHGEVLIADVCATQEVKDILSGLFPQVKYVGVSHLSYDNAKALAAAQASGRYILFLDGDCLPQADWCKKLLTALRTGHAEAVGGFTQYDGRFMAAVTSVMDFGFFYPLEERPLECYAFNNCGFTRELFSAAPIPDGFVRCRCYYHAQLLLRRQTPMLLIPDARVLHEAQPLIRERTRQGYDAIAACWTDKELPQTKWLKLGILSIPLFYAANVYKDWRRARKARQVLSLNWLQFLIALGLFPILRLLDVSGMVRAFFTGPVAGGWGGWFLRSRRDEAACDLN
jgi:hypothetical protein